MIKGVNKRVVEIICMDNEYFEKAVLYVKSDKPDVPSARLETEARMFMEGITPVRRQEAIPLWLKLSVAAALTVLLILVVYLIIFM
ncbi:MAG: hypothetical protein J1E40_11020 [Oscillospiraceae bacterium]|nr:hypothetical protein [Oscillospiraceae bacterium]